MQLLNGLVSFFLSFFLFSLLRIVLHLIWYLKGGTAPYFLLVTPSLNVPYNYSIPSSSFTNGQGSYSFQIPFSAGTEFVLTMSDATGFGSGGNSQILTVGNSSSGSCNTTGRQSFLSLVPASNTHLPLAGVDFTFQANSALSQCRAFTFSAYTGAVQPITILVLSCYSATQCTI